MKHQNLKYHLKTKLLEIFKEIEMLIIMNWYYTCIYLTFTLFPINTYNYPIKKSVRENNFSLKIMVKSLLENI